MAESSANNAAIDAINTGREILIWFVPSKIPQHIVEHDHRAIKRVTKPMFNFETFRSVGSVRSGVELIHMIGKGEFPIDGTTSMPFAGQFFALAGVVSPA